MFLLPLAFIGLGSGLFGGGRKKYTPEERYMLAALLAQSMEKHEEAKPYEQPQQQTHHTPRGRY